MSKTTKITAIGLPGNSDEFTGVRGGNDRAIMRLNPDVTPQTTRVAAAVSLLSQPAPGADVVSVIPASRSGREAIPSQALRPELLAVRAAKIDSSSPLPALELIRGLACLQVFLSHIFLVLMFHSRVNLRPAFWKLEALDWSYQSVMVFFVLSGFVIALSQQRKHRDFGSFMRSRLNRLEPLYLIALAISFGLDSRLYPPVDYNQLIGHLFFIQGSNLAPVFSTNAPLWSLGYEFYFYLVFALTIGRRQKPALIGWFILGLGAIVLNLAGLSAPGLLGHFQNILALSPVWLLGALLAHRQLYAGTNLVQHLMLFGMLPLASHSLPLLGPANSPAHSLLMGILVAPLLYSAATATQIEAARPQPQLLSWAFLFGLYLMLTVSFLTSNPIFNHHTETLLALTAPFLFLSAVPLYRRLFGPAQFFGPRAKRFSVSLGRMSYAIYIIHFPILIALGTVLLDPFQLVAADILLVLLLAWFLEFHLLPALGSIFDRPWQPVGRIHSH